MRRCPSSRVLFALIRVIGGQNLAMLSGHHVVSTIVASENTTTAEQTAAIRALVFRDQQAVRIARSVTVGRVPNRSAISIAIGYFVAEVGVRSLVGKWRWEDEDMREIDWTGIAHHEVTG